MEIKYPEHQKSIYKTCGNAVGYIKDDSTRSSFKIPGSLIHRIMPQSKNLGIPKLIMITLNFNFKLKYIKIKEKKIARNLEYANPVSYTHLFVSWTAMNTKTKK